MDRRAFITGVAGGLVIPRSVAEAQSAAKVYRVVILLAAAVETVEALVRALTEGLRDLGYIEGRNVVFERRYRLTAIQVLNEFEQAGLLMRGIAVPQSLLLRADRAIQ